MEDPAPLRPSLIWLFPLIFLIHDGEEAFTIPGWVLSHEVRDPVPVGGLHLRGALLAAYVVHVVTHIAQSVILGMYTPGVVSAVFVVLPVGGYLYSRLLRCRLLTAKSAAISAAAGVLAILPIVTTAHLVGRLLLG